MTMSDRERRLLAETAQSIEEQDPRLAAALRGWSEPRKKPVGRRATGRWRTGFQQSQRAPLRAAVAGGVLFVAGLLFAGHVADEPAQGSGAQSESPLFGELNLSPSP
jgi:hypothetical protein